ncbi:hypothetical protein H8958_011040 [Nasalis larvatus]
MYVPLSIRDGEAKQYGGWEVKCELSGQWLAHAIQTVRFTHESLTAFEIPNDLLQTIQDLILDFRVPCVMVTLQHTAEEIKRLAEKEDWIVDIEKLTSLPCQFEQCIVCSPQSLKGVLECKPGEASVFQQPKTQEEVCQLSINIMQVFTHCLEQLSIKPDADIDTTHLSVDVSSPDLFGSIHEDFSLTSEQRLLIVLSNYCYLERHTFLNIAEHFEKHNFQGIEKITQVLFKVIEAVSEELSRLMQCVSSFNKNGALQARLEICALRDTVAVYLTPESKSSFKQAWEALPQLSSGADKKLLEELLNKFKSSMHLQLTYFQAASSTMMKT